jgi:hypothetical protein
LISNSKQITIYQTYYNFNLNPYPNCILGNGTGTSIQVLVNEPITILANSYQTLNTGIVLQGILSGGGLMFVSTTQYFMTAIFNETNIGSTLVIQMQNTTSNTINLQINTLIGSFFYISIYPGTG